tara:strand:- start:1479 stop:1955 length:477 start_codon:yes stop_codon:yes gene_type:complete
LGLSVNFRRYSRENGSKKDTLFMRQPVLPILILIVFCLGLGSGCVSRRLTIRTNPPGALVKLNGKRLGFSPVSTDFTYYGTYEIELVKDGYETETILQKISAPWYQKFPIDFFSDNFSPFQVTNRHEYTWPLRPKKIIPTDDLLNRANQLRSDALIGP